MVISSHFDSLPLHPLPRRLESFARDILRLAETKGIQQLQTLSALLGVSAATLTRLSDYPLLNFGTISARIGAMREDLLATTFYHFDKKFGRSTRPSTLARFLRGSLSPHLRYCPACLSEGGYYSLTWRFLALYGCATHRCRLREYCGHCSASLPLFGLPLLIGVCLICREDLGSCSADQLSEQEVEETALRTSDLEYLLTPYPCEQENAIARTVGWSLAMLRRERGLFAQDAAAYMDAPENQIRGIEQGGTEQRAPLHMYLKYADYLGVSLRDVFSDAIASSRELEKPLPATPTATVKSLPSHSAHKERERELTERLHEVMPQLQALGKPITVRIISQLVGVTPQGLQHYPELKALWEQTTRVLRAEWEERRRQYEDQLIEQVQKAIATLLELGRYPSQEAIAQLVHMSAGGLRYYPRVRALMKESANQRYRSRALRKQPTEEELVERIRVALAHLESSKRPVTQQRISEAVELSLNKLRSYPQVEAILDRVAEERRLQRKWETILHEQDRAEQVRQVIQHLREQGLPVSQQTVGELVGLAPRALVRYHLVRPLLSEIVEAYRKDRPHRTKQRESELLTQVRQAVRQLKEMGLPFTQKAVSQRLNLSAPALMYYPRIRKVYYQMVEENRRARRQRVQQREAALFEQVQVAIQQMSPDGKPLTLRHIGRLVGMSVAGLRRYPRIKELLQQLAGER